MDDNAYDEEQEMNHEHEREHEHGHEHGHGHEHNHRESFQIACGEAFIEAHMHDQAATVSMAVCPDPSQTVRFDELVSCMQTVADQAEAAGGIIGHIKAFAKQGDAFAHASITSADIDPACEGDLTIALGEEADIQLVAIVLLIEQKSLIDMCRTALQSL